MSGMWRSNWHKSANLHRLPPNYFIVSSGNVTYLREVTKPLACGFLGDKEATAATSHLSSRALLRHHCIDDDETWTGFQRTALQVNEWVIASLKCFQMAKTAHWQVNMSMWLIYIFWDRKLEIILSEKQIKKTQKHIVKVTEIHSAESSVVSSRYVKGADVRWGEGEDIGALLTGT